jgi:FkbM family methyltransferase
VKLPCVVGGFSEERVRMVNDVFKAINKELKPAIFFGDELDAELKSQFFEGAFHRFFVEVGAYDPVRFSQTWQLEQLGWSGILVEPNPEKASILRQKRTASVYEAACSSRANSGMLLPFYIAGMYSSLLSKSVTAGVVPTHSITVRARTLDDILVEAGAPSPVDFISIDVEGCEIEVLDGLDLNRWCPRLLVVEDLVMNLRLHRYLCARGYRWFRRVALNGWYVPATHAAAISVLGHWQFFRKYYLGLPFRNLREIKRRAFRRTIPAVEFDRGPIRK